MKKQASLTPETEQGERPVERLLPAPPSDNPSTVLALIERVALDPRRCRKARTHDGNV
jgi:hypothetical protein